MQATAAMDIASDKGHHRNRGNIQKDKPSDPKKGKFSSSNDCNEARLTCPDEDWDFMALEQGDSDKAVSSIARAAMLEPSSTAGPDPAAEGSRAQAGEGELSSVCPFLSETYSAYYSASELENESFILVNSELDSEVQETEEFFDILEHRVINKIIALERTYMISDDDYKETAEDMQGCDPDGDAQQEHRSTEGQQWLGRQLLVDQAKTVSLSDLGAVRLRNSGYDVKHAGGLDIHHTESEPSSSTSLDSIDVYGQEDLPHVSEFQNSVMLKEHHKPKHEKWEEQETSLMYHTAFDEIVLGSSPENQEAQSKGGFLNSHQASDKAKIYTDKIKSQVTETKSFWGNATVKNEMLQHLENPSTFSQDKALETLIRPYKDRQTSWTSICDDSLISACEHSYYKSLPGTPSSALDFPVTPPRAEVGDNRAITEEGTLQVTHGDTADNTCFHSVGGTRPGPAAAQSAVTVTRTVDVSTDFRVSFTASRATSARPALVSTSSNTEITMMSKKRPGEWQRGRQKSVACNTEWSDSPDSEDPRVARTEGLLGSSSVDSSKPNGNFPKKDSLELRKTLATPDLKESLRREPQLSEEREKNQPPTCCQKMMQRAIRAEMHLLSAHYQLCHRQGRDLYRLVVGNRGGPDWKLPTNSAELELELALLSVLGDLKVKYKSLRDGVSKGVPLGELPPLSTEFKLLSAFSAFASGLMRKESDLCSGADSELDNEVTCDADVSSGLKKTVSQMSLLSDSSHPKQGMSVKEDDFKNGDIDGYFSQLELDDKDDSNYHETREDWCDAKENLTEADRSGMLGVHEGRDPEGAPEINAEPLRRNKAYLVHVGGLCPSVSEADLRSHFQKYQVSDISIYDSNYRYASLAFEKSKDAKSAAKEMNGIEINGRAVSVRLVKNLGECTSPLSSRNGKRVSLNSLDKNTNKEIRSASSVARLPKTRPSQLGPEPDDEHLHLVQQGVKNFKQIKCTKLSPYAPIQFIPPNTLNLRSFTKIMKRLVELHPDVSRDHIISALQKVRLNHKGFLNGLSINTIVDMTSSVLKNFASS
ncbi:LOW QUALITY PROTEIN: RNA-binding protein 44 [Saccopteryx bilineata]|uniref:LOW QUALITY PROTEIN: RNA-binding protein 44 n=1 Tax=Saccopteryx bilineata TaxID=59482 RepID=UPI00338FD9E9